MMHTHQRLYSPTPALSMRCIHTNACTHQRLHSVCTMHTHQRLHLPTPVLTNTSTQYARCILTNACTHQRLHSVFTMHTHQRLYSPTPALSMHDAYTQPPVLTNASTQYARCIHNNACTHQRLYSPTPVCTSILTNACTHQRLHSVCKMHTHQRQYQRSTCYRWYEVRSKTSKEKSRLHRTCSTSSSWTTLRRQARCLNTDCIITS